MRLALLVTTILCGRVLEIAANPTVRIGATEVIGKRMPRSKVDFFGGIPFAKPPLGDLRLNLPVLTTTLDVEKFDATKFGPGCLQIPSPPSGVSEDCLSVSIFRPSGISPSEKLPVIFWIYGGGFTVGDSSFYDPSGLVMRSVERNTPIIYVSVNYRIGPLGFPAGIEAKQANILNLGLHDQVAALEWVQANIGNFGGDKSKVTIIGESAGAVSVQVHLLGTKIRGLARAAIIESGGLTSLFGPEGAEAKWESWVSAIPGCASSIAQNKTFDCIRSVDTAALLQSLVTKDISFTGTLSFNPVVDGPQGLIVNRWSLNPPQSHLPLLIGSNLDEGTFFVAQDLNSTQDIRNDVLGRISPSPLSPAQVNEGLDTLLELYPDVPSLNSPFGTGNNTFGLSSEYKRGSAIMGDLIFTSGRRIMSQTRSEVGDKTFAYLFVDHEASAVPEFAPINPVPGSIGGEFTHTSEIPFVFGTLTNVSSQAFELAATMKDYWISFATSLDPNDGLGSKRPIWPQYTPENQVVIQLDGSGITTIPDNFRENQISFFANNADLLST